MEMLLNKVQISTPELGDTGFPAPVQSVPFAVTAAAPNACRFRDPAALFSASVNSVVWLHVAAYAATLPN
jgi:hypothetical protein